MHQPWLRLEGAGHGIDPGAQGRIHQMGIAQGGLHLTVAQKFADHFQRGATADQQRGEGVAQVVDSRSLRAAHESFGSLIGNLAKTRLFRAPYR